MKIAIGDIYSTVVTKDFRALGIVRNVCRARPKGFQFMPAYKARRWDGYISLMDGMSKFPTGLLGMVVPKLRTAGYQVELDWNIQLTPEPNKISADALHGITLRAYQLKAAERLLATGRGIAKMATNSGKTEVMAAMLWALERQSLVVVHRKELLYQTAERLEKRLGHPIGLIGDGKHQPMTITVAMIQTLSNIVDEEYFQDWIAHNKVLMIDECHNASSDQMLDTLYKIPGSYRYGFSGTPLKHHELSDLKLISITGRVLTEVSNEDLIASGYSAEPYIFLHVVHDDDEEGFEQDYQDAYQRYIVENSHRNQKIADICKDAQGVTLVIVDRVEHGHILRDKIPNSVFVSGEDTWAQREQVLEMMREGEEGTYIATSIFDEGVDVPAVQNLVIAAGGKSHIRTLQRIGRGLRRKEGDNVLHVHDFLDDTNKYLIDHSEARISIYEREGFGMELLDATDSPTLL